MALYLATKLVEVKFFQSFSDLIYFQIVILWKKLLRLFNSNQTIDISNIFFKSGLGQSAQIWWWCINSNSV